MAISNRWKQRRRPQRRIEAVARQEAWRALTKRQQLGILEIRGHGHCRQAERLRAELTENQS